MTLHWIKHIPPTPPGGDNDVVSVRLKDGYVRWNVTVKDISWDCPDDEVDYYAFGWVPVLEQLEHFAVYYTARIGHRRSAIKEALDIIEHEEDLDITE